MTFFADNRLYISDSTLSEVSACGVKSMMRKRFGWVGEAESVHLRCGSAVHAGLETWWKTWSLNQALSAFDMDGCPTFEQWSKTNVDPLEPKSHPNARKIMESYFNQHPQDAYPFKIDPAMVEVPFVVPLDEHVSVYGMMDGVVEMDGNMYVLDHKTTSTINKNFSEQFKFSSQTCAYVWAAREILKRPVVGMFINGIEFKKVNSSTSTCKKHGVAFAECAMEAEHMKCATVTLRKTEAHLEAWKQFALDAAYKFWGLSAGLGCMAGIVDVPCQGMGNGECFTYQRRCSYYEFCYNGRPVERVDQMFVQAGANPREEAVREMIEKGGPGVGVFG